jgi:hypothetical protein
MIVNIQLSNRVPGCHCDSRSSGALDGELHQVVRVLAVAGDRAGEAAQPRQQGRDVQPKRVVRVTHAFSGTTARRGIFSTVHGVSAGDATLSTIVTRMMSHRIPAAGAAPPWPPPSPRAAHPSTRQLRGLPPLPSLPSLPGAARCRRRRWPPVYAQRADP